MDLRLHWLLIVALALVSACDDSANSKQRPVPAVNVPPVADAGPDLVVLGGGRVRLQGSGVDPDGASLSYLWRQDGGFSVDLDDADSPNPVFVAPRASTELTLELRLTVTDAEGATDADLITIRVVSPGGVLFTPLSGNTGSPGAMARFDVRLQGKPTATVRIPVWSSDDSEGVPETGSLEFTPENWDRWQTVRVRGTNAAIQGGRQHYRLHLGAIESADPAYSGLDPEDVLMRGLYLGIDVPESPVLLMPDLASRIQARTSYSGHTALSHVLTEAPPGARIDPDTGEIFWRPGREVEGGAFDFAVRVTDNVLSASTRFRVRVARPSILPVVRDAVRSALVVTDSGTGLDGLRIAWAAARGPGLARSDAPGASDLSALYPEMVATDEAPKLPDHIERLSEIMLFRGGVREAVTLLLPLPTDRSKGAALYAYGEGVDAPQASWFRIGLPRRTLANNDRKFLEITLPRIDGLLFVGRNKPGLASGVPATGRGHQGPRGSGFGSRIAPTTRADPGAVSCQADPTQEAADDPSPIQICTSTEDPEMVVRVEGFGAVGSGERRWAAPGALVEDMISWIVDGRAKAREIGMQFDNTINVSVEDFSGSRAIGVVFGHENYAVLHLSNTLYSVELMRSVTVHEFFHHAQSRVGDPEDQLIRGSDRSKRSWLTEGSADWFAGLVFNNLALYNLLGGAAILNGGLNGGFYSNPYRRDVFFALLSTKCTKFADNLFPNILVTDVSVDPTGLRKLRSEIRKDSYACNFGTHLGEERKSSLSAALSYYQYATQFQNKASLLIPGAEELDGEFEPPQAQFDAGAFTGTGASSDPGEARLQNALSEIRPAGAFSFRVPRYLAQIPAGKTPVLVIAPTHANLIVSVVSDDSDFVGTSTIGGSQHLAFETREQSSLSYSVFGGRTPAFFVTVVNADVVNSALVGDIYLWLR